MRKGRGPDEKEAKKGGRERERMGKKCGRVLKERAKGRKATKIKER